MPTYRYRCQDCGREFDVWQSIKDDALRTHDDGCGGQLAKVLSPAGIVLKGSGFYRNDSRSGSPSSDAPKEKKEKESANGDSSKESSAASKDTKPGDAKSGAGTSGDSTSSGTKSDTKPGSPSTASTKSS
jgi:putative FmdB family regulatory protein